MLERYFSVLEKEKPALHWIARCLEVEADSPSTLEQERLAKLNREGSRRVRELSLAPPRKEEEPSGKTSLLDVKIELSKRILSHCSFCERKCGTDRTRGELGYCGVGRNSRYSSQFLHMGEEIELVPSHTIFFSGCNFRCVYCQNWDIAAHPESGQIAKPAEIAAILQDGILQGSRNANFVGGEPSPNLHTILETMNLLGEAGEFLPLVWNSNMYMSREAMEILDGVVDVYLGDFRYGNNRCAEELSDVKEYFEIVSRNFLRAYQTSEVMLRHLVLPGHIDCCTEPIMRWVSENIPEVYFNLMFQYRPDYRASLYPSINRRLSQKERDAALSLAREYGIRIS